MQETPSPLPDVDRALIGWWLFIALLAGTVAFLTYSFIGMVVLGVFGYYATRPIYHRLNEHIGREGIAAGVTVSLVIVPIVVLVLLAGFHIFQHVQQFIGGTGSVGLLSQYLGFETLTSQQSQLFSSLIRNPQRIISLPRQTLRQVLQIGFQLLSSVFGGLLLIALAIALSYGVLKHEEGLSATLTELFGGRDSTAYAYASAVDTDLESVFFGNLLFVVVMAIISLAAYWVTNFLAPQPVHIPMVFTLAFLTGVASLVPIVVGKVIYIPIVAYLGFQAVRTGGNQLLFVGGALVAYILILDLLPQTFIQPYITGRHLDMLLMMFAYLLGPVLFGWYGFFFLPIVVIVLLEAVRIVLPELVHGDPLTATVSLGEDIGTNPQTLDGVSPTVNEGSTDDDPSDTD